MRALRAVLVHDTRQIIDANEAALALFRCKAADLVGRNLLELVVSDEFKTLAGIHMQALRDHLNAPVVEYPFMRCDLSVFWARVTSENLGEGTFSMAFHYTFEEF